MDFITALKEARRNLKEQGAYDWLARGAPIVPLIERGKQPVNRGGLHAALTTVAALDQFFYEYPDGNYGIRTGATAVSS